MSDRAPNVNRDMVEAPLKFRLQPGGKRGEPRGNACTPVERGLRRGVSTKP